jgi:uncharacterized protein YutE (UPF0331/DUF86 family)
MTGRLPREDLIFTKLAEIDEGISLVMKHLPASYEEFSQMGLLKDGIYMRVEFAIEGMIDICAVINTDMKLGIPGNDEDMIGHLADRKIISMEMRERLRAMKGFRNILVHRYGKINDRLAFSLLKEHIGDFTMFRAEIEQFVGTNRV